MRIGFAIIISIILISISSEKEIKIKPNYLTTANPELCNNEICPPDKGFCTQENVCSCLDGYKTKFSKEMTSQCSYQLKKKIWFLLLELPGFGIGHFYANRMPFGILKLIIDFAIFSVFCCCGAKNPKGVKKEGSVNLMLMFVYFVTQVIDLGLIMSNYYLDGDKMGFTELF